MTVSIQTSEHKCDDCGGRGIASNGQIVCEDCGLVIEREITQGSYLIHATSQGGDGDGRNIQHVSPTKLHVHDKGLGSTLGYHVGSHRTYNDYKRLNPREHLRAKRLIWSHRRYGLNNEDVLRRTLGKLFVVCGVLGISETYRSQIALLIRNVLKIHKNTYEGVRITGFHIGIASTEYVVKKNGLIISNNTIQDVWGMGTATEQRERNTALNKCKWFMQERLGIKFPMTKPSDILPKTISQLKLSLVISDKLDEYEIDKDEFYKQLEAKARSVLEHLDLQYYQARNPYVIAASCLYFLGLYIHPKLIFTQGNVADATEAREYTIRDHTRNIWRKVIPDLLERGIIECCALK